MLLYSDFQGNIKIEISLSFTSESRTMITKLTLHFFLSLLIAAVIGCNSSQEPEQNKAAESPSEPQTPEEYVEQAVFTDLDGDSVAVADFKGKVVMIDFWETWCKPCLASFPTMQKLQDEYPDNFVVLAVTPGFTDTRADAKRFAENHDYTFRYLIDENNLHQKLGVQGIPYKVYVDAEGNFIKKSMGTSGPDGDYRKIKEIIEKHQQSDVKSET